MFAKFDEIPAITLQDIKETKRYGLTHGRTDNVKTVYPTQTKVVGYDNQRITLMQTVSICCAITLDTLLFGNSTLSLQANNRHRADPLIKY